MKEKLLRVICALIGHSRIERVCFGYHYCGRCGDQVGDSLGGAYSGAPNAVYIGHSCNQCRENATTLTWRDRLFAPDPFTPERSNG